MIGRKRKTWYSWLLGNDAGEINFPWSDAASLDIWQTLYRIFNEENIQWQLYSTKLKFFKGYNKTKFAAATKSLKTNYTFFVKPLCFLLIRRTRRSIINF